MRAAQRPYTAMTAQGPVLRAGADVVPVGVQFCLQGVGDVFWLFKQDLNSQQPYRVPLAHVGGHECASLPGACPAGGRPDALVIARLADLDSLAVSTSGQAVQAD